MWAKSTSIVGTCTDVYDKVGQVKKGFFDRVNSPTITGDKASGLTITSITNFEAGRSPGRIPSKNNKLVVPVELPAAAIAKITELGDDFNFRQLLSVGVLDGLREGADYTIAGSVSADKKSYDLKFTIKKPFVQFLNMNLGIADNSFFLNVLPTIEPIPTDPTRRALQTFTAENQALVRNAPYLGNSSFTVTLTAQNFEEGWADFFIGFGALLRVIVYLALIASTVIMIIAVFTRPQPKTSAILKFLEYVTALSWMVKVAFVPALYSIYELVFLDEIARIDTLFMGQVIEEREIRSGLRVTNKFGEYNIPVMIVNSGIAFLAFLVVAVIITLVAKVVTAVRSKGGEGSGSRSPMAFLELFLVLASLVTPGLFFYSTLSLWWNSHQGNFRYEMVLVSNLISLVFFVGLMLALVFALGGFAFALQVQGGQGANSGGNQGINDDLPQVSGGLQAKAGLVAGGPAPQGVASPSRAPFEVLNVWISLVRFAFLMLMLISLQNRRHATFWWLIGLQFIGVLGFAALCALKQTLLAIPQLVFEGSLTLLMISVGLTEAPDNRVENTFGNGFITFLIFTLMFFCVISKIVDFSNLAVGLFSAGQGRTATGGQMNQNGGNKGISIVNVGDKGEKQTLNQV